MKKHTYQTTVEWVGNLGSGTSSYTAYDRDFVVSALYKPEILGSADPAFRGDKTRWNPEDMLLASISACHKLWYLHFCAVNNIIVLEYRDEAIAIMDEGSSEQAGRFLSATLKPYVRISNESDATKALVLHKNAHQACFIANSLNFPVKCEAIIEKD
ncbi:OsmC family protein [Mannheimia varigena]|uniref:OsmC family protein n=1 Tax=Mannheimia varigena TaxID=85404 RepID=UPI0011067388|nr:OsmC family protein [Mannheimia varigena]TLU75797.1 OsmC family peroxiredoxin [Mannheimia varigena]